MNVDLTALLDVIRYDREVVLEVWVDDVSLSAWDRVIADLMGIAENVKYEVDERREEFAGIDPEFFSVEDPHARRLAFQTGRLEWVAGFFSTDSVYLQVDPREFHTEQDVVELLDIMLRISSAAGGIARLYMEGGHEMASIPPIVEVGHLA